MFNHETKPHACRELTPDTVKVHYFGWASKWDGLLPRYKHVGSKVSYHGTL